MPDKREDILRNEFDSDGTFDFDLQLAITLNPSIEKIKNVMDDYMKDSVFDAFEYVAKHVSNTMITDDGEALFLVGNEWINKEQLFENFL